MKKLTCVECNAAFERRWWNNTMTPVCSETCKAKRRAARRRTVVTSCKGCLSTVVLRGRIVGIPPYCSEACKQSTIREKSSRTMAATNRRCASERMKTRNPMQRGYAPVMAATLRRMHHKPPVQGGNGRPAPEPQRALAEALGWPMEVIVPTGIPRGNGWPTHFKIDVASIAHMVAIEVDGLSHGATVRKQQDLRKTEFLQARGWTVLRFSNREVTERLEACVQTVTSTTSRSRSCTTTSRAAS